MQFRKNLLIQGDHSGVFCVCLFHGFLYNVVDLWSSDGNMVLSQRGGHHSSQIRHTDKIISIEIIQLECNCKRRNILLNDCRVLWSRIDSQFSFSSFEALLEIIDRHRTYSSKLIWLSSSESNTRKIRSSNAVSLKSIADWNCLSTTQIFRFKTKNTFNGYFTFC